MQNSNEAPRRSWAHRFHNLMPNRVHEILLVSSAYDAFILSEDGQLSERLSAGFAALQLTAPPRVTQVETARKALKLLNERRFDLVLVGIGLGDRLISDFAREIKAIESSLPVVVLTFGEADLLHCPGGLDPTVIDRVVLWTGDAQILVAIIKLIEDAQNVAHDTHHAGVQVILVVEDSVRRYSTFLALLYSVLMEQSASLAVEGLNELHKRMRMRARPKVLLANTWEEAVALHEQHRNHVMALITDVDFPRGGEITSAGFDLVTRLRAGNPRLPVLIQSADARNAELALALGVRWALKTSPKLLATLRGFLQVELGFGPFIFRTPDGKELERAKDVLELERALVKLPEASLRYHAEGDHFSTWLNARGMFRLARQLQPRKSWEFENYEAIRTFLICKLRADRRADQRGRIVDVGAYAEGSDFRRLGRGSLGGKGRGVAFLHALMATGELPQSYGNLEVQVPQTVVIGTGEFQRFLDEHQPPPALLDMGTDADILRFFLDGKLAPDLLDALSQTLPDFDGPLAVRSSSLLEDSRFQPFAGVYDTWMLPNADPDPTVRLEQLATAIRGVWASTYFQASRAYFRGTPQSIEEERMGIVIQQVVGERHGTRFYPDISGVGQSRNYYPLPGQAAEDGVALMAVGLGHQVVSGGRSFRFSPKHPQATQFHLSVRSFVDQSQNQVRVLDLAAELDPTAGCESNLVEIELAQAEADGALRAAGSVYVPHDDRIRDDLSFAGPRVLTFNNILKYEAFPLADAFADILNRLRRAMGDDVEIEFAVDLRDWGRLYVDGPRRLPRLAILQARHMASRYFGQSSLNLDNVARARVCCRAAQALGDGVIEGVRDVIWVQANDLHAKTTPQVAHRVSQANDMLMAAERPYVLIGPGRWGTSDPGLGIPVKWTDICGAKVIIETPFGTRVVAPSQGTHFFHNITSLGVGYLTIADPSGDEGWDFIDLDWLAEQPSEELGDRVRHVKLDAPLHIHLQGREGRAALLKPEQGEDSTLA